MSQQQQQQQQQQQRQFHMMGGNYNTYGGSQWMNNDTTYTKIFVGGLAWETQRETMRKYFEQFGEILEAVVITDKSTGRSKGYGFVTFKEPEAAFRACQNPSPVIDGRRANCNLASLGAQKNRPPTPQHGLVWFDLDSSNTVAGGGRFRPSSGLMNAPTYPGSSSSPYFHQPSAEPPYPYSAYGFTGYAHDTMYHHMNYYGVYGQQFTPYYPTTGGGGGSGAPYHPTTGGGGGSGAPYYPTTGAGGGSGAIGYFPNYNPYYGPYAQSSQGHGFGVRYPQMVQQYPLLPHHLNSTGILSLPSSTMALPTTNTSTSAGKVVRSNISTDALGAGVTTTVGLPALSAGSGPSQAITIVATTEQSSST